MLAPSTVSFAGASTLALGYRTSCAFSGGRASCRGEQLIDRVIHRADVISIEGKSFRLREAEDALKEKRRIQLEHDRGLTVGR